MTKVIYGRGYVYSIKYHIVWCTKYRKKVLEGKVDNRLKELIKSIAKDNNFYIEELETNLDHIHLLINCSPQNYIPSMIKALKGVSARLLFKEFPELRESLWGGHLWNPSYFVSTISENTEDNIREYINSQKKKGKQ